MNKQDVYALLDENGFWHEITEHKAVYNMAELAEVECPYPEADAKISSSGTIKDAITTSLPSKAISGWI